MSLIQKHCTFEPKQIAAGFQLVVTHQINNVVFCPPIWEHNMFVERDRDENYMTY